MGCNTYVVYCLAKPLRYAEYSVLYNCDTVLQYSLKDAG